MIRHTFATSVIACLLALAMFAGAVLPANLVCPADRDAGTSQECCGKCCDIEQAKPSCCSKPQSPLVRLCQCGVTDSRPAAPVEKQRTVERQQLQRLGFVLVASLDETSSKGRDHLSVATLVSLSIPPRFQAVVCTWLI